MLTDSINQKIENYQEILNNAITITSILDSRNKVSLFELGELTTKTIDVLQKQFSLYFTQKSQSQIFQETSTSP